MNCPRCAVGMHEESYEAETLDRCGSCGGSWIARERLGAILESRERRHTAEELDAFRKARATEVASADESAPLPCPRCQGEMARSRHHYAAEVMVDRCRAGHGFWLDQGELEHIQLAVEEEEDRLTVRIQEEGLTYDDSASRELIREEKAYKRGLWDWFRHAGHRHGWDFD